MERMKLTTTLIFLSFFVAQNLGAPADSTNSLVVSSMETSNTKKSGKEGGSTYIDITVPQIYQMHIMSNVSNRFAHTTVRSKVRNVADKAQEATFSVVLPETAFIAGFIMEVDGKNYTAYVKEKEEAKRTYDQAVASGQAAAHVAVSARDSNRFTVSVNVEPEAKAAFYLNYEELLKREDGHYELVINLHPGQPVKDLSVEVIISESRKITDLKAPPLRSGNEIGKYNDELDPRAVFETINDTAAVVKFSPNLEKQKQLAHLLGTDESKGLAAQFVVQYDVERDPKGGEVLVQDGYFVHFFAPSDLPPLSKHIIFVLDTSSSMWGTKIEQLKEAMYKILEQLHDNDLFNLVEFNSYAKVWNLNNPGDSVSYPNSTNYDYWNSEKEITDFTNYSFPNAYSANADNIKKAKATVSGFHSSGGTDIQSALTVGLHLVELGKNQNSKTVTRQPIIVFLTDGQAIDRDRVVTQITEFNSGLRKSPIFALAFGRDADKDFLQKIAFRNSGFSKHIYEAADASLQLQDFYRQISSPLLANVTFKYEPSAISLTKTEFPVHFDGSELVVAGWCGTYDNFNTSAVDGWNGHKRISLRPTVQESVSSIERLWAYLTVKQLLEKKEISEKDAEELKKKALDLALKYSFVTSVSSLVVVKPNATNAVDTEEAAEQGQQNLHNQRGYISGPPGLPSGYSAYSYTSRNYIGAPGMPGVMYGPTRMSTDSVAYSRPSHHGPMHAAYFPPGPPSALLPTGPGQVLGPISVPGEKAQTPDLLNILPWLKSILNENGILSLPTGNYKLGLNETLSDVVACPKTPLNAAGHCTLLHSCPQVHSLLTSVDVFVNHFCEPKNEYAGICCPNNP